MIIDKLNSNLNNFSDNEMLSDFILLNRDLQIYE